MGNVSEHSGDLGRVVSLARVNEALCMADISVSELLWTTTSGLRDIGSVFRPESGNGRSPMSCRSCNLASTLTRINKGKDCAISEEDRECIVDLGGLECKNLWYLCIMDAMLFTGVYGKQCHVI